MRLVGKAFDRLRLSLGLPPDEQPIEEALRGVIIYADQRLYEVPAPLPFLFDQGRQAAVPALASIVEYVPAQRVLRIIHINNMSASADVSMTIEAATSITANLATVTANGSADPAPTTVVHTGTGATGGTNEYQIHDLDTGFAVFDPPLIIRPGERLILSGRVVNLALFINVFGCEVPDRLTPGTVF